MVAVRHGLMSAIRAVLVSGTFRFRGTPHRVGLADLNDMFVDVIAVHVMQVTVVKIVNMSTVANRSMSTLWAVLVGMVSVMFLCASRHDSFPLSGHAAQPGLLSHCRSAAWSTIALCAHRRTWASMSAQ
jgi:hypothetical protein